jgi:hypothetical protein
MFWLRSLVLVVSLSVISFRTADSQAGVSHTLNLDVASVVLEDNSGVISLSQIEAQAQGKKRDWIAQQPRIPLWSVVVQDASGERKEVTSLDGVGHVREVSTNEFELIWEGLEPGDVKVVVEVSSRSVVSVWNLEAEVRKEDYGLWDVTFPEVGPVKDVEKVHSITTYGWGVIHNDLQSRKLDEAVYPSATRAMPFVAVSDGTHGLYLGIEDTQGYPLRLFVGPHKETQAITLGLRHEIEDMGKARHFKTPYPVVLIPFEGDWYEAGRIYRGTAKSVWARVPPLSERKDIPQWLKDTDLWLVGACEDEATASKVIEFANTFGVPTAAHVYGWHQIPFDDHYPEYFPPKPGFIEAVAKVQAAGVPVMPYINGRLWDPATTSWAIEEASKACALNEQGKPYVEVYGSKVPLSPMCPSTELWKNKVTGLVDRLIHECGVKAVYIDQISAADAKRCFAENHGHPIGGGTYWIQGYRDLVSRCRAKLGPENMLTTEENADPWNDLLHAFLLVNTRANGGEIVPLYPAVYSGQVISFGFQYIQGEDFTDRYPLRLKLARALVFGSQLGWVGTQILEETNKTEAEFLKSLCQARHQSRDAFQYGELLAPPDMGNGGTVSWGDETKGTKDTQPAVLTSLWLTSEGKQKLVVVNVSDENQKVSLGLNRRHLDRRYLEQSGPVVLRLHPVGEGSLVELQRQEGENFTAEVIIPGRQVVVYEIQGQ